MMKRIVGLVAVLLPACTVNTPVVAGDKDPLEDDLGAWCTSMCDRLDACQDDPREVCAGNCVETFTDVFGAGTALLRQPDVAFGPASTAQRAKRSRAAVSPKKRT